MNECCEKLKQFLGKVPSIGTCLKYRYCPECGMKVDQNKPQLPQKYERNLYDTDDERITRLGGLLNQLIDYLRAKENET